jgi:formiminoglutamase
MERFVMTKAVNPQTQTTVANPAANSHEPNSHAPTSADIWQGRIDAEDGEAGMRFHQKVLVADKDDRLETDCKEGVVLLGFACDEGVKRNKGRVGAVQAPDMIRKALANMAWHHDNPAAITTNKSTNTNTSTFIDGGNIYCNDADLARSQQELAKHVAAALNKQNKVIVLGGGHEIAWGTFQGLSQHLQTVHQYFKSTK